MCQLLTIVHQCWARFLTSHWAEIQRGSFLILANILIWTSVDNISIFSTFTLGNIINIAGICQHFQYSYLKIFSIFNELANYHI